MSTPNIMYILADDMGYGDIAALNEQCAFPTPNLDRLAAQGMICTDAHSASAVCTPSRYSILTGQYCWRSELKNGVLSGADGPLLGDAPGTVAAYLRTAGYHTACVGKWHLGWDWGVKTGVDKPGGRASWDGTKLDWIDYQQAVRGGPCDFGFDHFFGISGSLDMPPYVYVEDRMPVGEPTAWGSQREFFRQGPRLPELRAHNVLKTITNKAQTWLRQQTHEQPFFLYFPLTAPHSPLAPAPEFIGKSGINPYCDFVMEVDHRVGDILQTLEEMGCTENTMVIFTSDNGVSRDWSECPILDGNKACRRCNYTICKTTPASSIIAWPTNQPLPTISPSVYTTWL